MHNLVDSCNPQAASSGPSKGLGIKQLIVVEDRLCPHDIALKSFTASTLKLIMHGVGSNSRPSRSLTPSPLTTSRDYDDKSAPEVNYLDQNPQNHQLGPASEKGESNTNVTAKSDSSLTRSNSDSELQVHTP